MPWFKERCTRVEYNQHNESETQSVINSAEENDMDVLYSSAKSFFTAQDEEECWMEEQYFQDYKQCEEVYSKRMLDKGIEPVGKNFFGLVTQEKRLTTGGLNPLRE